MEIIIRQCINKRQDRYPNTKIGEDDTNMVVKRFIRKYTEYLHFFISVVVFVWKTLIVNEILSYFRSKKTI